MIRLLVAAVGLFVIWVLFFSHFTKNQKILIVFFATFISVVSIWYENAADKPKHNIVQLNQVISCGVSAAHTYRSNFDINLCIRNESTAGHIKRLELAIIAEQCLQTNECSELERVKRDLSVNILPDSSQTLMENLSFNQVDREQANIQWRFEVEAVKAVNE